MVRTCIALTATVTPPASVPSLALRDQRLRLRHYRRAVNWWARSAEKHSIPVFVFENSESGDRMSEFRRVRDGLVTILNVEPPEPDAVLRGKGAGEAEILHRAASVLEDFDYIVKCTGRLRVLNWFSVVASSLQAAPAPAYVKWGEDRSRVDTRFLVATPRFLHDWMGRALSLVDEKAGCDLEQATAQIFSKPNGGMTVAESFARLPIIRGQSASTGTRYRGYRASLDYVSDNWKGWLQGDRGATGL